MIASITNVTSMAIDTYRSASLNSHQKSSFLQNQKKKQISFQVYSILPTQPLSRSKRCLVLIVDGLVANLPQALSRKIQTDFNQRMDVLPHSYCTNFSSGRYSKVSLLLIQVWRVNCYSDDKFRIEYGVECKVKWTFRSAADCQEIIRSSFFSNCTNDTNEFCQVGSYSLQVQTS